MKAKTKLKLGNNMSIAKTKSKL